MRSGRPEEEIMGELAAIYRRHGYINYRPACFEEYALYQNNRDFLIGKNVITFTDLHGRLLAMRPDVTLSLIRHKDIDAGKLDKYFYNEKVYRQPSGSGEYREINQTGVEVIGAVDEVSVTEVAVLACRTLATAGGKFVLDISHMGFTEGLLQEFEEGDRQLVLEYLKKKNLHDFNALAAKRSYPERLCTAFSLAVNCGGRPVKSLADAKRTALNDKMRAAVEELSRLFGKLKDFGYEKEINVNFSAWGNADYYNGVIFNGYVDGVPRCVLSGGRYDGLLKKFDKAGGAIGFALYLGEIERYFRQADNSVDYLILYDENTCDNALKLANGYIENGKSARLSVNVPSGLKYSELVDLRGEVRR